MIGLCIASTAGVSRLAVAAFTLVWTHSVEKVEWQEDWVVLEDRLILEESRVKGSGAGMEPGDNAIWHHGWWVWQPHVELEELVLGDSGEAGQWLICSPECHALADPAHAPYRLHACAQ